MIEVVSYDRVCIINDSENIESVSYSVQNQVALVKFNNTTQYRYYDIPIGVWADVISAPSVGKSFNRSISGAGYRYERVDL